MSVILEQRSQPQHVVHLSVVTKKATESLWTRGPFKCELTSIHSADVEGCSRPITEDEDDPIRILTAYREIMASLIQKHRGLVVDSPRDNLLIEFSTMWLSAGLWSILEYIGRHEEAIHSLEKAIRMNPFPETWYFFYLSDAYLHTESHEEAMILW